MSESTVKIPPRFRVARYVHAPANKYTLYYLKPSDAEEGADIDPKRTPAPPMSKEDFLKRFNFDKSCLSEAQQKILEDVLDSNKDVFRETDTPGSVDIAKHVRHG